MLTKTVTALSALLVLGVASAAFAADNPENKIGDRFPILAQTAQQRARPPRPQLNFHRSGDM